MITTLAIISVLASPVAFILGRVAGFDHANWYWSRHADGPPLSYKGRVFYVNNPPLNKPRNLTTVVGGRA